MDFRVQVACWSEEGRYCPADPQDVVAPTALQAAEQVCGKGLLEAGNHGRLAATVWVSGSAPPKIKRFYRPPN
jgi:hypothetical protein